MLQAISAIILCATTAFSYLNGQYGTAVICALCAGFVGGMVITKRVLESG